MRTYVVETTNGRQTIDADDVDGVEGWFNFWQSRPEDQSVTVAAFPHHAVMSITSTEKI